MADISQINLNSGYVPVSATQKKNQTALGWYPCHIVECKARTTKIKGKYKAKIYNTVLEVAPAVKNLKFTIQDIKGHDTEITGEDYIGRKFRSMGIFYFLNPQVGDDFEAHPTGNVGYMRFCEAMGIEQEKTTIDIGGKDTEVFKLTELSEDELLGLPVMGCVGKSKPWIGRDGNTRTSFEVKAFRTWTDGGKKDILDDIPF